MDNTILYGIILVIMFVSWYYLSQSYITESINEACKTGDMEKSSEIFWGIIWRYLISLGIGYACLIGYNMFFVKKD